MLTKLKLIFLRKFSQTRNFFFGKHAQAVLYNTENGLLLLPISDFAIARKLGFQGKWDMYEVDFLKKIIDKDFNLYIIGTHVGALLIPLSACCKNVIGFDANPDNYYYLNANLFLNKISNATILNFAVGNEFGKINFLQNKINTGGSKIVPQKDDFTFSYDHPTVISVDMVPMDDFIVNKKLPVPDFIIMDIEGAEYIALKGMANSINACKYFYIEYEPNHLKYVASCSVEDFFELFINKFSKVYFMRKKIEMNLSDTKDNFYSLAKEMFNKNIADDLLFSKNII